MKAHVSLAIMLTATVVAAAPAAAQSADSFYKDKRITMFVGSGPGGGYDTYARHVSRHLGRHVPGKPSFIVRNMPGAGGLRLSNHLYNAAPKDGTNMAVIQRGIPLSPLIEPRDRAMDFDALKFNWIGSLNVDIGVILVWQTAPHKTFKDLFDKELLVGSASPSLEFLPLFLNNVMGTKLKIISGYESGNDVLHAMERGEVQARVTGGWVGARMIAGPWLEQGKARILVVMSPKRSRYFPDVPIVREFARDKTHEQIIDLLLASQYWGRPFVMTPGVPQDRVRTVRTAFYAMAEDKDFLTEAEKLNLDIELVKGEEMHELLERFYASTPEVVAEARRAITPPKK